jgi:YHS domain-containing protein
LTVAIPTISLDNHKSTACQKIIREGSAMRFTAAAWTIYMLAAAALLIAPVPVLARDPVNTGSGGLAVKGYDPVAYFTANRPIKGSAEFEYRWQGVKWRFSSAENLEIFKAAPEKYAPQYGGY